MGTKRATANTAVNLRRERRRAQTMAGLQDAIALAHRDRQALAAELWEARDMLFDLATQFGGQHFATLPQIIFPAPAAVDDELEPALD